MPPLSQPTVNPNDSAFAKAERWNRVYAESLRVRYLRPKGRPVPAITISKASSLNGEYAVIWIELDSGPALVELRLLEVTEQQKVAA